MKFLRENASFLAVGFLLTFCSSFGQTFFISLFSGDIRAEFNLSHGAWGGIYMIATLGSAAMMVWSGSLTDTVRVRTLSATIFVGFIAACIAMASVSAVWMLFPIIFALRQCGQGMFSHISGVAISRWFDATRGRALSISGLGYSVGEALLPYGLDWMARVVVDCGRGPFRHSPDTTLPAPPRTHATKPI